MPTRAAERAPSGFAEYPNLTTAIFYFRSELASIHVIS
jgi:hypothetical protein